MDTEGRLSGFGLVVLGAYLLGVLAFTAFDAGTSGGGRSMRVASPDAHPNVAIERTVPKRD